MKKTLLAALIAVICVPYVCAEKVFLKNGQVIQGKLALEETESVIVQTGDNKYKTILRSDIEAIKPDNAAPDAVFDSDGTPAKKKKTLKMLGDQISIEGHETIVRMGGDAGGIMDISVGATTQDESRWRAPRKRISIRIFLSARKDIIIPTGRRE